MPRKKDPRVRIGHTVQKLLTKALRSIRAFRLLKKDFARRETTFNTRLIKHLQNRNVAIATTNIPPIQFLGETFRNDGVVGQSGAYPLFCIECKKTTDANVKSTWKEGLAQCELYSTKYKYVFYVIYDFTTAGIVHQRFGKDRKNESTFARNLREGSRIDVVVLKATK